jgi:hypothetical protein
MKRRFVPFAIFAVVSSGMSGCISKPPAPEVETPSSKTSTQVAQQIVANAAGYCKAMADKKGVDFLECFQKKTDDAIVKIQADASQSQEDQKKKDRDPNNAKFRPPFS